VLWRVGWNVVRIRRGDSKDNGHNGNTWRYVSAYRATKATYAQDADALSVLRTARRRGCLLLMRAAVWAADAVDRIQRREHHQHQDGGEPTHLPIICATRLLLFDMSSAVEHP
jgi:hypothetical protein